jgi:hypothetical protein
LDARRISSEFSAPESLWTPFAIALGSDPQMERGVFSKPAAWLKKRGLN